MDGAGNWSLVELVTDYLDGFQYAQNIQSGSVQPLQLKFVPTSEGYFDFVKNKYIYHYTDHLGNVRVSYLHNGSSIEVLEENNYYPFGLKHEGYNALAGNPLYQYRFQGQELQETGWYSFKWRNYMPDVGRFFNIDPLAEEYSYQSPYNFAENQVIAFVELEGLEKGLPWYLNESKQGGKPVLTLGAHNIKLPYTQRSEYKGNAAEKVGTFVTNTLGSIYNGVASSWNEAMEGKTAGQMAQEGDRDMETTIRDAERNGINMEHIEAVAGMALIHKSGKYSHLKEPNTVGDGLKTTSAQRKRILKENMSQNNGQLTSDGDGRPLNTPKKVGKGQKADMNQAEVDHIDARSKGGSNSNKNLRVISKEENLKKGNR